MSEIKISGSFDCHRYNQQLVEKILSGRPNKWEEKCNHAGNCDCRAYFLRNQAIDEYDNWIKEILK